MGYIQNLKANKTKAFFGVSLLAMLVMSVCAAFAPSVAAGTVETCTITVTKDNAVVEGASVTLYEATREYWGLWYSRGDVVAANVTGAVGTCTFSNLDDTKYYQAVIIVGQNQYQVNFLGNAAVAAALGYTAQIRGEVYVGAVAVVIFLVGMIALGWMRFTNRAPVVIGTK